MKKAQSAVEAAIVIGVMTLTLIIFLLVITDRSIEVYEQKQRQMLDDLASVLDIETSLALKAGEGYNRTFTLPATIQGIPYTVDFIDAVTLGPKSNHSEIILKIDNPPLYHESLVFLPRNVVGNICIGNNEIAKREGLIRITCIT